MKWFEVILLSTIFIVQLGCGDVENNSDDINADCSGDCDSASGLGLDTNTSTETTTVAQGTAGKGTDIGNKSFDISPHLLLPVDGVATNISTELWCYAWHCPDAGQVASQTMATEGDMTIEYQEIWGYGLAFADGFFTELFGTDASGTPLNDDGTVTMDLDAVPNAAFGIAGTVIFTRWSRPAFVYGNREISVSGPDGIDFVITTDSLGRYGLQNMPAGEYTLNLDVNGAVDTGGELPAVTVEIFEELTYQDIIASDPLDLD